jgi:hypothetical protein
MAVHVSFDLFALFVIVISLTLAGYFSAAGTDLWAKTKQIIGRFKP